MCMSCVAKLPQIHVCTGCSQRQTERSPICQAHEWTTDQLMAKNRVTSVLEMSFIFSETFLHLSNQVLIAWFAHPSGWSKVNWTSTYNWRVIWTPWNYLHSVQQHLNLRMLLRTILQSQMTWKEGLLTSVKNVKFIFCLLWEPFFPIYQKKI